jgi:2-polyprenyl-3-methyl-5-hydroxy-6-metoxy-1,4-benzoquinol methylase
MDFSRRSYQKELLDSDDVPFDAIKKNMEELDQINRYLGGHAITIAGFKKLAGEQKEISVCEIGCGGGDNLRAIQQWCSGKNIQLRITGIDINPHCIDVAKKKFNLADAGFLVSDYRLIDFGAEKPDIVFASLFCHHFTDTELTEVLGWMRSNSTKGFFINDLHRHPLAYYSIALLTRLFSRSYLVKNDAPLSVLRGFNRKEWKKILEETGIKVYFIQWKWAFRWLIMINNN